MKTTSLLAGAAFCALLALPASATTSCPSLVFATQQSRTDATSSIYDLETVDYDQDNKPDVIGLTQDNGGGATLVAWKGVGNGTFQVPVSLGTTGVSHMITADVNNDGRLDILMTTSGGSLLVRLGNGTGFDAPISKSLDFPGSRLVAVSADGDAFLDLVTTSINGDTFTVFHGVGNGNFTTVRNVTTRSSPWSVAAGDFDGDGRVDVAYSNFDANTVSVVFKNSDGSYTAPLTLQSGAVPDGTYRDFATDLEAADLDEDGRPELVATNWEDTGAQASIVIFRPGASRTFTRTTMVPAIAHSSGDFFSVRTRDVNGDNHVDLVASSVNSGLVMALMGKGDGSFYSASYYVPEAEAGSGIFYSTAMADFDSDGTSDLAVGGYRDFIAAKGSCATQLVLYSFSPVITQGQSAPLRALVSGIASSQPLPRGTVTFREGATVLGVADVDGNGSSPLDVSGLALGDHTVTAEFSGNASVPAATSPSIVQKVTTTATVTNFVLPSEAPIYGTPYTFSVEAHTVQFSFDAFGWYTLDVDGAKSDHYTGSPVTVQLTTGPHTLTASYHGSVTYPPSVSSPQFVTAVKATPSMTNSSGALSVRLGTAHSLQFAMTGPAGFAGPTGTVQLMRGATNLGSCSVSNGGGTLSVGSCTVTATLERGTHDVSAVYSGDTNFNGANLGLTLTVMANLPAVIEAHGLQNSISIRALLPPNTTSSSLYRRPAGTSIWGLVSGWTPQGEFDATVPQRGVVYEYRVSAIVSGVEQFSNVDSAMLFNDDTLVAGQTKVRRVHFDELLLSINALRATASLAPVNFDVTYAGTLIRASHLATLRTALAEARQVLGMVPAAYTDNAIAGTAIKAVHIQELREQSR